ncbi:MAG: hypothetical protein HWD89_03370 [Tenacibaculum sp.]|uniref:hypothetical protein n=1 Tax=Tenacibaculum sp. TaxID=1906242 RepID=UPI0018072A85|nr:hypothetical protein [Tenacibaculum sp.]NVK08066.1 hypothetical protein [Tenacibaculum sp.]
MRVSKDLVVYLPAKFVDSLKEELKNNPPPFAYKLEYFLILYNYILNKQKVKKKQEFHALNKVRLKEMTVSNIERYIVYLKRNNFIISDGSFQENVKSLHYKLNDDFITDEIEKYLIKVKSKAGKNILKRVKKDKAHYNRLPDYKKKMQEKIQKELDFDYEEAFNWIDENLDSRKKLYNKSTLESILDKRFRYFRENPTNNRIETNLTSLKRELRRFMVGEFVSFDLKNCQPLLFGMVLKNITERYKEGRESITALCCYFEDESFVKVFGNKGIQDVLKIHQDYESKGKDDFIRYYEKAIAGILYDDLCEFGEVKKEREDVKKMIYPIFFSKNFRYNEKGGGFIPHKKEKLFFNSVYPSVGKMLEALKKENNRDLPIYLQQFESYLFIECIAKELVENGIVPYTIHDSVIVEKEYEQKTLGIIESVLKREIGVIPAIDKKYL